MRLNGNFKSAEGLDEGLKAAEFCLHFLLCLLQSFIYFPRNLTEMDEPSELSLREIHAYFLRNNYKVTNTQLVKHFRKYLTGPSISKWN
jgi:hypothetical protein